MTMSLSGAIASSSSGSYRLGKADAADVLGCLLHYSFILLLRCLPLPSFSPILSMIELEFTVSNIYKQHSRNYG
jgi:hypothetical protein